LRTLIGGDREKRGEPEVKGSKGEERKRKKKQGIKIGKAAMKRRLGQGREGKKRGKRHKSSQGLVKGDGEKEPRNTQTKEDWHLGPVN